MSPSIDVRGIARKAATLSCTVVLAAGAAACGANGSGSGARPASDDLSHVAKTTTAGDFVHEAHCSPGLRCAR